MPEYIVGSLLHRMGSQDDVTADNPTVVAQLREQAIRELARRGADPALVEWFESEGTRPPPESTPLWDG
jgi:hypothetical protein